MISQACAISTKKKIKNHSTVNEMSVSVLNNFKIKITKIFCKCSEQKNVVNVGWRYILMAFIWYSIVSPNGLKMAFPNPTGR